MQNESKQEIIISRMIVDDLIGMCLSALPHKAYGMIGGSDVYHPRSFYPCSTNLRNTPEWKGLFESFGEFYRDPDLGFVIAPVEVRQVIGKMEMRGESFVGVFHSHRILPARPSEIDIALSSDPSVFSYIVSVADPSTPEIAVFRLNGGGYQQIPVTRTA